MKYTVEVTMAATVEVDDTELKAEFGKVNKRMVYQEALNQTHFGDRYIVTDMRIIDIVKPVKEKITKGIGSY